MLGSCRRGILLSVFTSFFGWAAQARDIRIDDSDSTFFSFTDQWASWTPQKICDHTTQGCAGNVDQGQTFDRSYHHGFAGNSGTDGECKFRGSGIAIFGVDLQQQGLIRFRLDDSSPVAYDEQPGKLVYNSEMFRATGLATDIEHTLRWTVEQSSTGGGSIVLDYAVITVPDVTNTPSPSPVVPAPGTTQRTTTTSTTAPTAESSDPSGSSTSTRPLQTETKQDTRRGPSTMPETTSNIGNTIINPTGSVNAGTQTAPDATSPTSTETSVNKGSNTAAIAGGVVGGMLGALVLGALVFLFIRRKRHRRPPTPDVQPFASQTTWTAPPSFVDFQPVSKGHRISVQASSDSGTVEPASDVEARLRYLEQRLEAGDLPPPSYDMGDRQSR